MESFSLTDELRNSHFNVLRMFNQTSDTYGTANYYWMDKKTLSYEDLLHSRDLLISAVPI